MENSKRVIMKYSQTKFCTIYNRFMGDEISDTKQIKKITFKGEELFDFAEFYVKEKFEDSGLKHFYIYKERQYIALGVGIGLFLGLVIFLIIN